MNLWHDARSIIFPLFNDYCYFSIFIKYGIKQIYLDQWPQRNSNPTVNDTLVNIDYFVWSVFHSLVSTFISWNPCVIVSRACHIYNMDSCAK